MANRTSARATPKSDSRAPMTRRMSPQERENMIREAAYFRYLERGSGSSNELDDWFAAKAELFGDEDEIQAAQRPEAAEHSMQEGGPHGFWEDDALKRIVKQHPRSGIPLVDSVEPPLAPRKE